jgi:hypothetical protein
MVTINQSAIPQPGYYKGSQKELLMTNTKAQHTPVAYIHEYKCTAGLTKCGYEPLKETVFSSLKEAKNNLRKAQKALRKRGLGLGVFKLRIAKATKGAL